MNKLDALYCEIEDAEAELKALETMSEQVACSMYNVDYKVEAITLINEDLAVLRSNLEDEINRLESWD